MHLYLLANAILIDHYGVLCPVSIFFNAFFARSSIFTASRYMSNKKIAPPSSESRFAINISLFFFCSAIRD